MIRLINFFFRATAKGKKLKLTRTKTRTRAKGQMRSSMWCVAPGDKQHAASKAGHSNVWLQFVSKEIRHSSYNDWPRIDNEILLVIEVFLKQGGKLQLEIFYPPETSWLGSFLTWRQFGWVEGFSAFRPSLDQIQHVWAEEQHQRDKHILFFVLEKSMFKSRQWFK